eukprot:4820067-Prymnesium_polylepis.1
MDGVPPRNGVRPCGNAFSKRIVGGAVTSPAHSNNFGVHFAESVKERAWCSSDERRNEPCVSHSGAVSGPHAETVATMRRELGHSVRLGSLGARASDTPSPAIHMLRVALLLLVTRAVLADSAGCEDLTAPYGHIQSEDGNYQDNTERCWHIHPPGKSRVLLSFKYFRTEANYDYVDVFDGADISAPRLSPEAGFSGSVVPKRVNSTQ